MLLCIKAILSLTARIHRFQKVGRKTLFLKKRIPENCLGHKFCFEGGQAFCFRDTNSASQGHNNGITVASPLHHAPTRRIARFPAQALTGLTRKLTI
jgi:hypothetical protein